MTHWTNRRKASFVIHALFVLIPFIASSGSALVLWYQLFGSWWYAVPLVISIDVLTLAGLVLHIARIPSPFTVLRHFLPLVSVGPLGIELHRLLADNGNDMSVTWPIPVIVSVIFSVIIWQCFVTIERLFIDPLTAAREKATEATEHLTLIMTSAKTQQDIIAKHVTDWQKPVIVMPTLTTPELPPVAPLSLSDDSNNDTPGKPDTTGYDMQDIARRIRDGELSKADAAAITGKSERSIYRWLASQKGA